MCFDDMPFVEYEQINMFYKNYTILMPYFFLANLFLKHGITKVYVMVELT